MKKLGALSAIVLILSVLSPMHEARAIGCGQVKNMFKSVGSEVSFENAKGAQKMVDAYKIALANPKCFGAKDIKEMKSSTNDIIKMCNDTNQSSMMQALFGKATWSTFCKGFKSLSGYTK